MQRLPDWSARLMNAVETATVLPFSWGLHDCCTFAAHCVDAMCGTSIVTQMQRQHPYHDEDTAYARIAEEGGFVGLLSKYLGEPMTNPLFAHPGDIALAVNSDGKEIVGVVIGHGIVVPGLPSGIQTLPTSAALAAWRI